MKNLLLLCLGLTFLCSANAQEQLGLRTEYQAGVNGITLNPAATLTAPFPWQVNLLEGTAFFENNYGYLRQTHLREILGRAENLNVVYGPDLARGEPSNPEDLAFFVNEKEGNRFANLYTSAMGPSFYVKFGGGHSLGLITRARTLTNADRVSATLSYDRLDAKPYLEPIAVDPLEAGVLSWTELGVNAVFQVPVARGALGIGITARYLTGFEGFYLRMEEPFELTKVSPDSLLFSPFKGRVGYTTSNLGGDDFRIQPNGTGFGIDLGLIYTDQGDGDAPYRWRIGASLLDLGGIRFDRNARTHRFDANDPSEIVNDPYEQLQGIESVDSIFQIFSEQVLGDPASSRQEDPSFFMWLPSAFSLQADRALSASLFMNATLVQGFPLGPAGVRRGSLFAFTPRWETRWLGLSVPVSLYNWEKLHLGLGLRLGFLYLGTDHLGSLLARSNFSGTDLYFALRFQPWWRQKEKSRSRRAGRKGGRGVDCYQF